MGIWLLGAALAAAGELEDLRNATERLRVTDEPLLAEGQVFQEGPLTLRFDEGAFFPIRTPDERLVGVAFWGEGHFSLSSNDPDQAVALGNWLAGRAGASPAELQAFVRSGEALEASLERAVIWTVDPALQRWLATTPGKTAGGPPGSAPSSADEVVTIVGRRETLRPRLGATDLVWDRKTWLHKVGLDVAAMLQEDRVAVDGLGDGGARWVIDAVTDRNHGAAGETAGEADRTWTLVRDPRAAGAGLQLMGLGLEEDVIVSFAEQQDVGDLWVASTDLSGAETGQEGSEFATSTTRDTTGPTTGVVSSPGEGLPSTGFGSALPDPTDPRTWDAADARLAGTSEADLFLPARQVFWQQDAAAAPSWRPISASGRVVLDSDRRGLVLAVDATLDLTIEAVGGAVRGVWLDVPREQDQPGSWSLVATTPGGDPLEVVQAIREDTARVLVALPEPVQAGQQATLRLALEDTWALERVRGGIATREQPLLPDLSADGPGGTLWPVSLETRVRANMRHERHVAVSGATVAQGVDEDYRWVQVEGPVRDLRIVVGEWAVAEEPGGQGLPDLRMAVLPKERGQLAKLGPAIRQNLHVYSQLWGPVPVTEIDFAQPAGLHRLDGARGHGGLVTMGGVDTPRWVLGAAAPQGAWDHTRTPPAHWRVVALYGEPSTALLGRELALDYWGQTAASADPTDAWIARVLAELQAWIYVGALHGPAVVDTRLDTAAAFVASGGSSSPSYPLTRPTLLARHQETALYHYGLLVFLRALPGEIGLEAVHAGLKRLVKWGSHRPLTTADVQRAFEVASGEDLTDFFQTWVHGGAAPSVRVAVAPDGPDAAGCVTTNLPFGRFTVPIEVRGLDGVPSIHRVEVRDGVGRFRVEDLEPIAAAVDPAFELPLRGRAGAVLDEPACR